MSRLVLTVTKQVPNNQYTDLKFFNMSSIHPEVIKEKDQILIVLIGKWLLDQHTRKSK